MTDEKRSVAPVVNLEVKMKMLVQGFFETLFMF